MPTMIKDEMKTAFLAGVAAADPKTALLKSVAAHPLPDSSGRRIVLAVGKAAVPMSEVATELFGPIDQFVIVTNPENAREVAGAELYASSHPVPDAIGLAAGQRVIEALQSATDADQVIVLLSGGASSLLPAPIEGISLADKVTVNEVLLASGMEIEAMNLVRQNLSQLKGGGILHRAAPAKVYSFVLSDVLGDDLRAVGSGPSVGPIGTPQDAIGVLQSAGVWDTLPESVRQALRRAKPKSNPDASVAHLIGSNSQSLAAMASAAGADISTEPLVGDVDGAARRVVREALSAQLGDKIAFGGETTVVLKGDGRGGRNQELALRVAMHAEKMGLGGRWAFLSGGTDGRDGPTDAAGAIVDHESLARCRDADIDLGEALGRNDSYPVLARIGALLMTGGTGTNVADLQLMVRLPD